MERKQLKTIGQKARLIANEACALENARAGTAKTKARIEKLKQMVVELSQEVDHG